MNILITGASGNIGRGILNNIKPKDSQQIYLASRENPPEQSGQLSGYPGLYFDFENPAACKETLKQTDILFLLRPPHISNVKKYFEPLIDLSLQTNVQHIVFLSVQGAENSSIIPHAKIEKLILASKIPFTFIRPGYFMQNLTTILREDIRQKQRIFLPAGKTQFNWIDADDIGRLIARVLENPEHFENQIYTPTGNERLTFEDAAAMLSRTLGKEIRYISPNIFNFFYRKKQEGIKPGFIMVMLMLHFLPRMQKPPEITDDVERVTGIKPKILKQFIEENKQVWS